MKNTYDETKELLGKIRKMSIHEQNVKLSKRNILKEESENVKNAPSGAIAITNDAKFGENVLQNQIDEFKQAVNGGAKFAKENTEKAESNALVFFPKSGNLVFSGSIPSMADLKFQFSLNDITASPYIFVDGLSLTEDVVSTLNKIRGFYLNWRDEWLAAGDLLDKLTEEYKNKD